MSQGNGQTCLSLEDSVRQIIRDPQHRKAFRDRWPMYDAKKLAQEIVKADADILAFEGAIQKAQRYKRECQDLIKQCRHRDDALQELSKSSA